MNTRLSWYLCLLIVQSQAFTHWMVTENGRIEPKLDTYFYMRRPYDLISLLDQEKRRVDLDALIEEMAAQRNLIDHKSLQTSYIYNQDCAEVPKDIPNSIVASNASDRVFYELQEPTANVNVPAYCSKFTQLPFSMKAFEHLESMQQRRQAKEETCEDCLPEMNWEAVGPTIVVGLQRNSSSWLHYNLGILYWWRLGNIREAIECARRALHYAPPHFYDIPLANLGNLLYFHSDNFEDALTVIKAATDHAPNESKYYLLLGKAYIHKGEYETGVKCFEKFKNLHHFKSHEKGDAQLESSESMSCILKALIGMKEYQDMLQGILTDLHDFHQKQQKWLSLQERFLWEIAPNEYKMTLALSEQVTASSHNINTYKGFKNNIEKVLDIYKEKFGKSSDEQLPGDSAFEKLPQKYPTTMRVPSNLYFDSAKWPTKEQCVDWNLPISDVEDLNLPIFLPLENKGYDVTELLSKDIDQEEDEEHPLPWYPPLCRVTDYEYELFAKFLPDEVKSLVEKNKPLPANDFIRSHFLSYINNGNSNEAEIGQRIVSAMQKKKAPIWTLSILANMYWRIRGNTKNAIQCLGVYVEPIPTEFTDVAFVSMGSMLYQMGLIDHALKLANLAARVNFNEPSTNFLLALIYYKRENPLQAMYYLQNVLRVDPFYYNGEAERLLKLWSCRIKLGEYELQLRKNDNKRAKSPISCTDSQINEGVICSPNGEKCKTAAIQCFKAEKGEQKVLMGADAVKQTEANGKKCNDNSEEFASGSLVSNLLHSDANSQDFHMRIFIGDEEEVLAHSTILESTLGDFHVSVSVSEDPVFEVLLNVHDKSGTYVLSKRKCKEIRETNWLQLGSMWEPFAARNLDISTYLAPLQRPPDQKPHCKPGTSPDITPEDQITSTVLRRRFPLIPEEGIAEWLGLMAGDPSASVTELGAKISAALRENTTSWILATAAAVYWRIVGSTEEAVMCIRQALNYVPSDMKDIPLLNLANVLQNIGSFNDALEVIEIAMEINPLFVVNHFTAGNIYTSLGEYENAVALYRSSLALDFKFEPARNRLQAALCTLLFDEMSHVREAAEAG